MIRDNDPGPVLAHDRFKPRQTVALTARDSVVYNGLCERPRVLSTVRGNPGLLVVETDRAGAALFGSASVADGYGAHFALAFGFGLAVSHHGDLHLGHCRTSARRGIQA